MSMAGPMTRSKSKRSKPTEPVLGVQQRANPTTGPSLNVNVTSRSDCGRRMHSDKVVIGLALGSPGQSPLPPLPSDDRDVGVSHGVDVSYSRSSPEDTPRSLGTVTDIGSGPGARRKGNRWKSFGTFFGKKDSAAPTSETPSFYRLDRIPEQESAKQHIDQSHVESNTLLRKRADSSRSKTGTDSLQSTIKCEGTGLLRRNSSRKKGLRRRKVEEMKPEMSRLHTALSVHAEVEDLQPPPAALRRPMASLLQVEIPNVELDRYSVMFGDLLGTKPQPKSQHLQESSLSTRRQGHIEALSAGLRSKDFHQDPIDDLLKPPCRRADSTSSKSSKTPSFSLFPSSISTPRQSANSGVNKPLPKPSPLGRSITAPNTLARPDRPRIQKSKSDDQDHVFVFVHRPGGLPSTPTSRSRRHSLDPPCTPINSTQASFFECPELLGSSNLPLDLGLPGTTSKGAKEAILDHAFPIRKSSMKEQPQPLEESEYPDRVPNRSAGTAAEISVARQISISRRQQQLLVPVAPRLARQPRQPTLVNGVSTPAARKSHHLTLEDA